MIADPSSWPSGMVPADISRMVGQWKPNLLVALIHTALWTRPPLSHGIHLSDFWAWLRYHRAIAKNNPELHLCEEWGDIDPHQKTILSDELGVGFTTYLLSEKLGCIGFVDTLYLQKRLSSHFPTSSRKKNGRSKSPDYISIDDNNKLYILECKGTQTSRAALKKAIKTGIQQKKSVSLSNPSIVEHSIVAGLFIPQWGNKKEHPCIMISDPTWQDVETMLSESIPTSRSVAILQILLAKHFSLIGLSDIARALTETDAREFEFSESMQGLIERWLNIPTADGMRTLVDTERDISSVFSSGMRTLYDIRFLAGLPKEIEVILIRATDDRAAASREFRGFFERLRTETLSMDTDSLRSQTIDNPRRWRSSLLESSATVTSPLGFEFCLELDNSLRTVST